MFHQLSFMLVIQLCYSNSGMPVKRYYYFSYESVLDFLRESALWLRGCMKHTLSVHTLSVQRSVTFTSFWIWIKRIQNNVTIFSLVIRSRFTHIGPWKKLKFNTLYQEKVQRKCLGCIKSQGDHLPLYFIPTLQEATGDGWKSRMWLASRGLPTPDLADSANITH